METSKRVLLPQPIEAKAVKALEQAGVAMVLAADPDPETVRPLLGGRAGLDVFEEEPVSEENPLLGLDNIIMTPHSAALTQECVVRMAVEAVYCTLAVFNGRVPPNVANPQVLTTARWKHLAPAADEQQ